MTERDTWSEWSRHVLKELERLNDGQDQIKHDIQDLKSNLQRVAVAEQQLTEMKQWKDNVTEIYSVSQLKEHKQEIESLKTFKTRFVTIWAVVQFVITIALALFKMG